VYHARGCASSAGGRPEILRAQMSANAEIIVEEKKDILLVARLDTNHIRFIR